jgi:hypothetical protein
MLPSRWLAWLVVAFVGALELTTVGGFKGLTGGSRAVSRPVWPLCQRRRRAICMLARGSTSDSGDLKGRLVSEGLEEVLAAKAVEAADKAVKQWEPQVRVPHQWPPRTCRLMWAGGDSHVR